MQMAVDIWYSVEDLAGIIGAACSTVSQPISLLAASWGIPVISWASTSDSLSNKEVYPTFTRVEGTWSILAPVLNDVVDHFGWNRIGVLYAPDEIMKTTALDLGRELQQNGKNVIYQVIPNIAQDARVGLENQNDQQNVLRLLKEQARIFIFMCYMSDSLNLMMSAKAVGMLNGDYTFITHKDLANPRNSVFEGILVVSPRSPSGPEFDAFLRKVLLAFDDPRFDGVPHLDKNGDIRDMHIYAGMFYCKSS